MHEIPKAAENSFNAVRLLAALQVAYVHAIAWLKLTPTWGYDWIIQFPGVLIFFAVSGYLVFDSLLRLGSFKQFALHRASRIYPALVVNILILEIALYAAGQIEFTRSLPAIWAFFFFISYVLTASYELASQWVGSGGGTLTFDHHLFQIYPSGVLWTLTVELTFYAFIPLVALVKSRVGQTILIVTASAASFAYQKHLGPDPRLIVVISVIPYFWIFGIGMLVRLWRPPQWTFKIFVPALLIAYVLVAEWRGLDWLEWKTDPVPSASLQTVLLALLALAAGRSPLLKSKWLAKNDASYGTYLYHMLIVTGLMNIPIEQRTQWLFLPVIIGGIAAGLLSWHLIERPAMKYVRRNRELPSLPQTRASMRTHADAA